jgi:hypothetical protein
MISRQTLSFFSLSVSVWMLCQAALSQSAKEPDVPQLFFPEPVADLGQMWRGETKNHTFKFLNLGQKPVRIVGVHTPCGCTVVDLAEKAYGPQEEGQITVAFNSTDHEGSVVKPVMLMTSEPLVPERVLTVKANIASEILVDPPLVDFGPLLPGQPLPDPVHVILKPLIKDLALQIGEINQQGSYLSVQTTPLGNMIQVTVSMTALPPAGPLRQVLRLSTNAKGLKTLPIPVMAEVAFSLRSSPEFLDFGQLRGSKSQSKSLRLEGVIPFVLEKIETDLFVNGEKVDSNVNLIDLVISNQNVETKEKTVTVTLKKAPGVSGAVHGQLSFLPKDQGDKIVVSVFGTLLDRKRKE